MSIIKVSRKPFDVGAPEQTPFKSSLRVIKGGSRNPSLNTHEISEPKSSSTVRAERLLREVWGIPTNSQQRAVRLEAERLHELCEFLKS